MLAVMLAACGGERTQPQSAEEAAFEVDHTWSWSEAGPDGYNARTRFELGRFGRLGDVPHLPGFESFDALKDSCLFDEETDALAPIAASMTSGMTREASLTTRIVHGPAGIYGTNTGATELIVATSTPDGVECEWLNRNGQSYTSSEERSRWEPVWQRVRGGATTGRAYAYLVIRDLLVEDPRKGSSALRITRSYLGVEAQPGGWITSIDGPRDPPSTFGRIEFAGFSLDPRRPPCGMPNNTRCIR
jgi:hypothetical protein